MERTLGIVARGFEHRRHIAVAEKRADVAFAVVRIDTHDQRRVFGLAVPYVLPRLGEPGKTEIDLVLYEIAPARRVVAVLGYRVGAVHLDAFEVAAHDEIHHARE